MSLSTTLLTVAFTVRVALNAPAVSSAGTSSHTARFTQLLGAIVAFDTWSSVTAKSFASVPAMPKFAFVASNVALLLHTVRVISVPAVPIPAVPKVTCDGVMDGVDNGAAKRAGGEPVEGRPGLPPLIGV